LLYVAGKCRYSDALLVLVFEPHGPDSIHAS
jgi:hypothetical protein